MQKQINTFDYSAYYTVKYDKFQDVTRVSVTIPYISPSEDSNSLATEMRISIVFAFNGDQLVFTADDFVLSFTSTCRTWCFMDHHLLTFLVDKDKLHARGSWDGTISEYGGVIESVSMMVKRKTLLQIANAKNAEFQLGDFAAHLTSEKKDFFRNIVKLGSTKLADVSLE